MENGMTHRDVSGWFVSTQVLVTVISIFIAVWGGTFAFFLSREKSASEQSTNLANLAVSFQSLATSVKNLETNSNRTDVSMATERSVNEAQEQRIQRLENNVSSVNEKMTEIVAKVNVVAALLEGRKKQ